MDSHSTLIDSGSASSLLSWNTYLSRTSVSSISRAAFSNSQNASISGFDNVLRVVKALEIPKFQLEEIQREEVIGEGETFLVERCIIREQALAIKHLKVSSTPNQVVLKSRLKAAILELCIMRHRPLRRHPNITTVFGYGWNQRDAQPLPYLLVPYAPFGTLRQYLKEFGLKMDVTAKQILIGDVASGLSALHLCQIVHGDVKLENVLVFHSWDRPAKALAKLTDFGHSLVITDKDTENASHTVRYGGTYLYNAPEIFSQSVYPIRELDAHKCDVWAFGLLAWEVFLDGKEFWSTSQQIKVVVDDGRQFSEEECATLWNLAKEAVPLPRKDIRGAVLRALFPLTLQPDPVRRISDLTKLPVMSQWHAQTVHGIGGQLALHLDSLEWSYDMFRPENGAEIPWDHEEQIFMGIKGVCDTNQAFNRAASQWQLALCYFKGFGTTRDLAKATQCARSAQELGHVVVQTFQAPFEHHPTSTSGIAYASQIRKLLQESVISENPSVIGQAFFIKDTKKVLALLSNPGSVMVFPKAGITLLHLLFMSPETSAACMRRAPRVLRPFCDLPSTGTLITHEQWPLQLVGSPLTIAISTGSVESVRLLLKLGANPCAPAYGKSQYPEQDERSAWTPLHVAVQYHSVDILRLLLERCPNPLPAQTVPLALALPYSSTLERLALHPGKHEEQLKKTVKLLQEVSSLRAHTSRGMTPLTKAIDFDDETVVRQLLEAHPALSRLYLWNPREPEQFNLPIHFAAQLAARRNVPDTLRILKLINTSSRTLGAGISQGLDYQGRTALHLSVTGRYSLAAVWILQQDVSLLHVNDYKGLTPLFYCASAANCEVLLSSGASAAIVDKRGVTPLHQAVLTGDSQLIEVLLVRQPPVNQIAIFFGAPLHGAVIRGSMEIAVALLDAGAMPNIKDSIGNTPLHVAAMLGRNNIMRLLLERGGRPELQNKQERPVWDCALSADIVDIIQQHLEKSNISASFPSSRSPASTVPVVPSAPSDSSDTSASSRGPGKVNERDMSEYTEVFSILRHKDSGTWVEVKETQPEEALRIEVPGQLVDRIWKMFCSDVNATTSLVEYFQERYCEHLADGRRPEDMYEEFVEKMAKTVVLQRNQCKTKAFNAMIRSEYLRNTDSSKKSKLAYPTTLHRFRTNLRNMDFSKESQLAYPITLHRFWKKPSFNEQEVRSKVYVDAVTLLVDQIFKPSWGHSRDDLAMETYRAVEIELAKLAIQSQRLASAKMDWDHVSGCRLDSDDDANSARGTSSRPKESRRLSQRLASAKMDWDRISGCRLDSDDDADSARGTSSRRLGRVFTKSRRLGRASNKSR